MIISKDITITEAVDNYPHALETLNRLGIPCEDYLSPQAHAETLEDACRTRGLDVDTLIKALKENVH